MIRTAIYFIKESLRGLYHAKLMTFISIITIGFALFLLGCMALTYINVRVWLRDASSRVEAVVFVKDSVASDSVAAYELLERVRHCSQVAHADFVDKKEAWKRFKENYGAEMLNAVDDNPFPASIEISLKEQSQSIGGADGLKKELERIPAIEDISISHQWVQLLQRFKTYFMVITACAGFLLVLALHFMIANTIKLTIYARRELVRNMHFVGATDFYIRMPFIFEGMLQGFIGGLLAVSALFLLKFVLVSRIHILWGPWYSFLFIFTVGALFGCIGSMSAVRKFLV
jgi:cell division transport system permease protein